MELAYLKYWKKMSTASILMPAGIVQLKLRAFNPEDARKIAQAALEACEDMINEINARADRDAVANAEAELKRTSERVASALAALETARNETGILETSKSADSLQTIVPEPVSQSTGTLTRAV